MQDEPSALQDPADIIQISTHDLKDVNFPVKIMGVEGTTLYVTGGHMHCMSFACYIKLKDPLPLKKVAILLVHTDTGHDICPIEFIVVDL